MIFLDFFMKGAAAGAAGELMMPTGLVNNRSRNIFNGLLRVPVNEIIPALNLI